LLRCSRRLTIRELSPLSPLMVIQRRGERAEPAVFFRTPLAPVIDARGLGLRAICEHVQELRELGVSVLFHEPGDVVAAALAAGFALD
jgi:hypothetical protein